MADEEQERTEQATPRKRGEARKQGQAAKSREITSGVIILGMVGLLIGMGPMMVHRAQSLMVRTWSSMAAVPMTEKGFYDVMRMGVAETLWIVIPMTAVICMLGVASVVVQQGGFLWTMKPITPDISRLNPLNGIKNFFSLSSLVELGKALIKFIAIGYVAYSVIREELPNFLVLIQSDPRQMMGLVGWLMARLAIWTGLTIVFLGGVDFVFQRWQHERKLRMSRQEMKEEMKQTEGNPLLRSRVRTLQREITRKRMMSDVPKADVVITNPTELAVALMYRQSDMEAPQVVAKGAGFIAEKIRDIARRNGIPIMENKPLARALYKNVEIGERIPQKLYRAVAEVLAYVYRLRGKKA